MIELLFLGTGSAWPRRGQGNTAFLVQDGNPQLLVDCGPTALSALTEAGVEWSGIQHIFLTHKHGDHILGLPILLLRFLQAEPAPLTIIGGQITLEAARHVATIVYPELEEVIDEIQWIPLSEDQGAECSLSPGTRLRTLPAAYPPGVPVLALRIEFEAYGISLAYSADTAAAPHLADLYRGADLLIHEANFSAVLDPQVDPAFYGHGTARDAARLARLAGCKKLALIHMAARYSDQHDVLRAEAAAEFDGEIVIPEDGDTLVL